MNQVIDICQLRQLVNYVTNYSIPLIEKLQPKRKSKIADESIETEDKVIKMINRPIKSMVQSTRSSFSPFLTFPTSSYLEYSNRMVPAGVRQVSRTIEYRTVPMKTVHKPPKVIEIGPSTSAIRLHFTSMAHPSTITNFEQMSLPTFPAASDTSIIQRVDHQTLPSMLSSKPVMHHEYIKPLQYFIEYRQPQRMSTFNNAPQGNVFALMLLSIIFCLIISILRTCALCRDDKQESIE